NREVKPTRADGTAVTRGRVGRCQILKKAFQEIERLFLFIAFLGSIDNHIDYCTGCTYLLCCVVIQLNAKVFFYI
uniref:hypothetical protein n=1 Tax=Pedobacter hartonius TaxID=425514 RepID=UPI001C3169B5